MGVIHKYRGARGEFRWEGVAVEGYGDAAAAAVSKQVVIGPADGAASFALRYFEVAPGGRTALDRHDHDHGVMVLRGRGVARLGKRELEIGFGDVLYIAPRETHQLVNTGPEPLGFLCVIPPKARPSS
jgi:quercetin dioxygenase-like cupin family protein